ncbi:MAG: N-acetylmuramoyl-L-alanine amidase [Firmicutes bacterium]|nr:N-acetylmuramoyl-L-alanine amidase [Bacillota bacterium]
MPNVYLSPSTQEYNEYVTRFNEEFFMNLIADAIEPYLIASGIEFSRNDPNLTVGNSVRQSNAGDYDLHVAIHSNASAEPLAGQNRGVQVYYYLGSEEGKKAADIFTENFKSIYPLPEFVQAIPTVSLYELANTKAPSVLMEVGFHDNIQDAQWLENNIDSIAEAIAMGVATYFGIPLNVPDVYRLGTVATAGFDVNIRATPSFSGTVLDVAPNGAQLAVLSTDGEWYRVNYNDVDGYIYGGYIILT